MKAKFVKIGRYMADRLQERSTWAGFALLLTAAGIAVDPEQMGLIITIGMGAASLLNILLADDLPPHS
jgi:hypothetical protein